MIIVRCVEDSDRDGLRAMLTACGNAQLAKDFSHGFGSWSVLVAADSAEIVGMLQGRFDQPLDETWRPTAHGPLQAWVFNLLVANDRRRQGTGTRLMDRFCAMARAEGCTFVALRASPLGPATNIATRRAFFRSYGLRAMPGGEDHHVMGMPLADGGSR